MEVKEDNNDTLKINLECKSQFNKLHKMMPKPHFFGLINGPRNSGKSVFIRNLIKRKDMYASIFKNDDIFIMSPSLDLNDDYEEIKTKHKFSSGFSEVIKEIIDKQTNIIKKYGKKRAKSLLLILDDILGDKSVARYGIVETLATKGRHMNISVIVVTQRLNGISREVRLNIDFLVSYLPYNYSELESVVLQYLPRDYQKKMTKKLLELYGEEYNFLYINNQIKKIDGKIFFNFDKCIDFNELE
jgi:hypothetical protein